MSTVVRPMPVYGASTANSASEGTVYSTPVPASTGPARRGRTCASAARGSATSSAMSTAWSVSVACCCV